MNILKKALGQVQQPKCKTANELLTFADIKTVNSTDINDNSVECLFKATHPNAKNPIKATEHAGAYDVYCTRIDKVSPSFVICWVGFALKIPDNFRIMLQPRSSLCNTTWLLQNTPGLGDSDFINEYSFRFRALPTFINNNGAPALGYDKFPYKVGDRIGQCYLEQIIHITFKDVDELPETGRKGGYGHTGN